MELKKALQLAFAENLDLVKIAPFANPPVCKIMDYGKFKFDQAKKEKESKKNQKAVEIKEVRLSINIDTNDFNTKLKNAIKFLKTKNKVKVAVRLRGRELQKPELGFEILDKFKDSCEEYGLCDSSSKLEGRSVICVLSPKLSDNKQSKN